MSEATGTVMPDKTTPSAPPAAVDHSERAPWHALLRWESGLVVVLIATLIFAGTQSTNFFTQTDLFYIGLNMGEIAIMALPLTLIVMTGEIDLSVASMLGLSGTLLGYLFQHGWNVYLAMLAALVVGAVGGALNGVLITKLGLPSIAVTIGTLTLFRGVAEIILGTDSVTGFPLSLTKIGVQPIQGTQIAYSVGIFIVMAVICAVVLHATPLGRSIFAIGLQSEAARFAGIRVNHIKFWLYVVSGVVCAFAGLLFTLKNASARFDAGTGLELNVVAIVLFGGVSIFGGRGSVLGVVLSVVIVGCLQQALTQMQVDAQVQNIVLGGLLLVSVIVPNGAEALSRLRARARRRVRA